MCFAVWAAQMTENCGIWAWMQNSIVYHATSPTPYGPYKPVGPAIAEPEAHEPIVARAPTVSRQPSLFIAAFLG